MTTTTTPSPSLSRPGGRIYFLDEVRGFDLILMVFFHAFYVIGYLFQFRWEPGFFSFSTPRSPFSPGCSSSSAASPAAFPTTIGNAALFWRWWRRACPYSFTFSCGSR